MQSDWYGGRKVIDALTVQSCQLHTIAPFAFNATVFEHLKLLRFVSLENFEFSFQSWPIPLFVLKFENCEFRRVTYELLSAFTRVLQELFISNLPDEANFTEIFRSNNRDRFLRLNSFEIIGVGGERATRSLTNLCLPRLPRIHTIVLNRCGIERIHPNTFAFMGETLITLNLDDNKLKTLSIETFAALFDVPTKYQKIFFYLYNPLECTCDFYELNNFTYFSHRLRLAPSCLAVDPHLNCDNMQTIAKEKLYSNDQGVNVFGLSKVNIRIAGGLLIAKTKFTAKFRLLIINHKGVQFQANAKCPTLGWIRDSVKCFLLPNRKTIYIRKFLQKSELITFCAILTMLDKRVWPLHIQTYRNAVVVEVSRYPLYALIGGCCLECVLLGFMLTLCYGRFKRPTNLTETG